MEILETKLSVDRAFSSEMAKQSNIRASGGVFHDSLTVRAMALADATEVAARGLDAAFAVTRSRLTNVGEP